MPYYDTKGLDLIMAERFRQLELGFDSAHDDTHATVPAQLLQAAECYILAAHVAEGGGHAAQLEPPAKWPWTPDSWKPTPDPIRNLTKAGALVAAELDRLLRRQMEVDGRAKKFIEMATGEEGRDAGS